MVNIRGRSPLFSLKRALASFWAMPIAGLLLTLGIFSAVLWLDLAGGAAWASRQPFPLNMSGDTVLETASTLATVLIGLFTLFFSITLIVLTMASSSLGVRLIDRWIDSTVIKVTLSALLSLLVYAFLLQFTVQPDGPDDRIPRLTALVLIAAMVLLTGWLSIAFHHLSRRIHVDTSIVSLGDDLLVNFEGVQDVTEVADAPDPKTFVHAVTTDTAGYVEDIDLDRMCRLAHAGDYHVCLPRRRGSFVLQGDVLAWVSSADADEDALLSLFSLGGFRTNGQGARFQIMLLAEIAARALSPALNDLYTAMACIDHIVAASTPVLAKRETNSGWLCAEDGQPRVFPQFDPVMGILDRPLDVIRHAAVDYPSVCLHLVEMTGRLHEKARLAEDRRWLKDYAAQIVEGAVARCQVQADRDALEEALADFADDTAA